MKSPPKIITLRQILYLVTIGLILGIIKVEFFISFIDKDLIERTRTISYITLGISSIFFYFIISLAILASYFIVDMMKIGTHFNMKNFYFSINYFVWTLILNEFVKFFITIFTFDSRTYISTKNEFNETIANNEAWRELITLSDFFFIAIGAVTYAILLKEKDKNINYLEALTSTLPLFFLFLIFRRV